MSQILPLEPNWHINHQRDMRRHTHRQSRQMAELVSGQELHRDHALRSASAVERAVTESSWKTSAALDTGFSAVSQAIASQAGALDRLALTVAEGHHQLRASLADVSEMMANPAQAAAGENVRLGYLALENGWHKEAKKEFIKSIDLVAIRSEAWVGLGYALLGIGNAGHASEAFKRASKYHWPVSRDEATYLALLSASLIESHDEKLARAILDDAHTKLDDHPSVEVCTNLARLGGHCTLQHALYVAPEIAADIRTLANVNVEPSVVERIETALRDECRGFPADQSKTDPRIAEMWDATLREKAENPGDGRPSSLESIYACHRSQLELIDAAKRHIATLGTKQAALSDEIDLKRRSIPFVGTEPSLGVDEYVERRQKEGKKFVLALAVIAISVLVVYRVPVFGGFLSLVTLILGVQWLRLVQRPELKEAKSRLRDATRHTQKLKETWIDNQAKESELRPQLDALIDREKSIKQEIRRLQRKVDAINLRRGRRTVPTRPRQ